MAVNNNPIFVGTPIVQTGVTTTVTSRDGAGGTYTLIFNPGPDGSRIERVTAIVAGTVSVTQTTAMAIRLYIKDLNTAGQPLFLYREALLPASLPGNAVVGSNVTFNFNGGLCLGTQSQLFAGASVGDTGINRVSFIAEGGNF